MKIYIQNLIIFSIIILFFGCTEEKKPQTLFGLIPPANYCNEPVDSNKEFTITAPVETCGPGEECAAIIYKGTIDLFGMGTNYVGIAVNDSHPAGNNDFKLLIYFEDTNPAIPEGNVVKTSSQYSVYLKTGTSYYSTPSTSLDINITKNTGTFTDCLSKQYSYDYYTIVFNSDISLTAPSGFNLQVNTNTIVAMKYPEKLTPL